MKKVWSMFYETTVGKGQRAAGAHNRQGVTKMTKYAILPLGLAVALVSACAATISTQVERSTTAVLRAAGSPTVERDNVTITATAVADPSVSDTRDFFTVTTTKSGSPDAGTVVRETHHVLVRLPAFLLTVLNRTGHVISFDRAVVVLANSAGETFQPSESPVGDPGSPGIASVGGDPYAELQRLQAVQATLAANEEIRPAMNQLRQSRRWIGVGRHDPILPEGRYVAALVFDVPPARLAQQDLTWTLKIYDFVTETDPAGNPARRTRFDFAFAPYELVFENTKTTCEPGFMFSSCP